MILEKVKPEHIEFINKLNKQQDFRLASIENCLVDRVVIRNNKIVAYGIVKKMAEAIILVDLNSPKITRAKAMRELMQVAELGARQAGCSQLHIFVKDWNLAESLKKHYDFIETQDIVLAKEL